MVIDSVIHSRGLRLAVTAALMITLISCRPNQSANAKRYEVKGKVVAVNKDDRTATIDHDEIVGYMQAMTMEFDVKDDAALKVLEAGDQVTATLVVGDSDEWLENFIVTKKPVPDPNAKTNNASEAQPGAEVPDFKLLNQDGKRIHLAQYRGQVLALTFIYTRCPDPNQCTLMSTNFAAVDQALQKDPETYRKTHLLSVTFDPEYDTPRVLKSYGAGHTARYSNETFQHWEFATGTKDEVKSIAQYFGLTYFRDAESGQDKVVHSLRTAIIGPDGKLVKVYRGNDWKPEEMTGDLKALVTK